MISTKGRYALRLMIDILSLYVIFIFSFYLKNFNKSLILILFNKNLKKKIKKFKNI